MDIILSHTEENEVNLILPFNFTGVQRLLQQQMMQLQAYSGSTHVF